LVRSQQYTRPSDSEDDFFVDPTDTSQTKQWVHAHDYLFLSIDCESSVWFLPSSIPNDLSVALIAHSSPFPAFDVENLCVYSKPHSVTKDNYHYCKIAKVPDIYMDANRKFISPGYIVAAGTNKCGLAHRASSTLASSGGPIVPVSDTIVTSPIPFLGIHLGTFSVVDAPWNYAVSVCCKTFFLHWFTVVFPQLLTKVDFLPTETRQKLHNYLLKAAEISDDDTKKRIDEGIKNLTLKEIKC